MPYVTACWTDINIRSHTWSGEVVSHDRRQLILKVQSIPGAKEVIIQGVKG